MTLEPIRGWLRSPAPTFALVAIIASIAFLVSFDAISAYAVRVGAFPPALWWSAPLLVDTFTVAGGWVVYARSGSAGVTWRHLVYPWSVVAAGSAVSIAVNVAHAPAHPAARALAALPPVALLASLELVMGEARRLRGVRTEGNPAHPAARATVRELLEADPEVSARVVQAATGVTRGRAYELLREERAAASNGHREGVSVSPAP
jgi:hypothetical protein